jgi:uncharacterized Fe-S cluster-containing radical SAM superfamily enzyme
VQWFDHLLVVSDKVVVQLKSSGFLLADDNISDLQEDSVDFRILAVESSSSFDTARALVGLKDEQEFGDKFIAFFH